MPRRGRWCLHTGDEGPPAARGFAPGPHQPFEKGWTLNFICGKTLFSRKQMIDYLWGLCYTFLALIGRFY